MEVLIPDLINYDSLISPEEIKRAAMSETNKAFDRYMGKDTDADMRSIYRKSARVIPIGQGGKELVREKTT
ncbi:MAG: hypothetical protein Q8M86_05040 [Syntrophales bacterium]|nr:hypothetical protein [Syntrophales bacterium]MDP3097290.1 hypothetical protein [Syntrophales bacterium]